MNSKSKLILHRNSGFNYNENNLIGCGGDASNILKSLVHFIKDKINDFSNNNEKISVFSVVFVYICLVFVSATF